MAYTQAANLTGDCVAAVHASTSALGAFNLGNQVIHAERIAVVAFAVNFNVMLMAQNPDIFTDTGAGTRS